MRFVRTRKITAKLLRGVGYICVVLEWLWISVIILPPLMQRGAFDAFIQPQTPAAPILKADPITLSGPVLWLIALVTIAVIVMTIIVLIKLPKTVIETGDMVVRHATDVAVPIITHHASISEKKRRVLSRRSALGVQIFMSLVPAIVSLFLPAPDQLSDQVIVSLTALLMVSGLIAFVLAYAFEPPKAISRIPSRVSRG